MAEFTVEAIATLPRQFQPMADRSLTTELRGMRVRSDRGDAGEIRLAYAVGERVRAFVRFSNSTGWFSLTNLDPDLEDL